MFIVRSWVFRLLDRPITSIDIHVTLIVLSRVRYSKFNYALHNLTRYIFLGYASSHQYETENSRGESRYTDVDTIIYVENIVDRTIGSTTNHVQAPSNYITTSWILTQ